MKQRGDKPLQPLDDPFLKKHLNPLFLQAVQSLWHILQTTQDADSQQVLQAQRNLMRFVFRRLFQPLYLDAPLDGRGKVFFLSCIHSDGIGDYFALLKGAKAFAERQPRMEVHVAYRHQQQLPPLEPADYLLTKERMHDFHEVTDYNIIEGVLEGRNELPFEQKLREVQAERQVLSADMEVMQRRGGHVKVFEELMDECDRQLIHFDQLEQLKAKAEAFYKQMLTGEAFVHIALALNTFDNPVLAARSLYFAEAGNFAGIANLLQRNWYGMGLEPFEEGIFLRRSFSKDSAWKDDKLPKLLWQTAQPTAKQIQDYHSRCCLHLAYLPRIPLQQLIFLYLVAIYHKGDARDIAIVLPKIERTAIQSLDGVWLGRQGIRRVTLIDFDVDDEEKVLLETAATGQKTLRLIHRFPLAAADFEKLVGLSDALVGCTGDQSLGDCLIANKIPFYELRQHKLATWQALVALAVYLNLPLLVQYFNTVAAYAQAAPIHTAESLCLVLQNQDFNSQWQRLLKFINKYYCLEYALVAHVNRQLCLSRRPELKEREEAIVSRYLEGAISAADAYAAMQQDISRMM